MINSMILTQKERYIDQITMVTRDIFRTLKHMTEIFELDPWSITRHDNTTDPGVDAEGKEIKYSEIRASVCMADGVIIQLIQPVTGNTIYKRYLDRFGDGICGVRERIPSSSWEAVLAHFESCHVSAAQRLSGEAGSCVSLDLMDQLGCIIELIREDNAGGLKECSLTSGKLFGQLCIVTSDVEKTARFMNDILLVGPWEIGHSNEKTIKNPYASDVEFSKNPEFEFMTGMSEYANFQFELIQPTKGPMPYFGYLANRDVGFHHIKEVVGQEKWAETLARYNKLGIKTYLSGKIGPCSWSNLDTEAMLGFVYELGDGVPMDKLPEGYDPYMFP